MVVIPNSSLIPSSIHHRKSTHLHVSTLQKYSQNNDPLNETVTLLSSPGEQQITRHYQSANLLNQQALDLEVGRTPEALQLKVVTNVKNRLWIMGMTKRVLDMNTHLESRLLDLNEHRISLEEIEEKINENL